MERAIHFSSAVALSARWPVFWLEWAARWAFGVSWFVKGEAILGDK